MKGRLLCPAPPCDKGEEGNRTRSSFCPAESASKADNIDMELVLISPQGFDFPPDLVAAKMSTHALLQSVQRDTLIVSSDCLGFVSAFEACLNCPCAVDYAWDEQHTEGKSEPAHIAKVYVTDLWKNETTYDQFRIRVRNEAISEKKAKRAVLCNLAVIEAITGWAGVSICKFDIQSGNAIPVQWATYEEISQLFESDRLHMCKQQNTAKAQAIAAAITSTVSKSINEVPSNSADFPGLLTQILSEQLTAAISQLEQGYKQSVEATLGELQQKSDLCSSRIASLKGVIGELEAGQQATLRALGTFGPGMQAGGAVGPRIAQLKKTTEQFWKRIESLYEEIPDRTEGKLPLMLTIDQSGVCTVDNRKRYPLKGLKLLYSADGQARKQLIELEVPASGRSQHPFRFPEDPAKVLSFVICQNDREVSQSVELGLVQDAPLQSAPPKPGIGGAWPSSNLGVGGPSVNVETGAKIGGGINPLGKTGVSRDLYPGSNSGGPVPGLVVPSTAPANSFPAPGISPHDAKKPGALISEISSYDAKKPEAVIPPFASGAPAKGGVSTKPSFGFQQGQSLGLGGPKPKPGPNPGLPIPPPNN